ncbi:succinate dehydrogenase assembly factor 2, mitochondrial isoform X1 [Elaeis guineensis]|uniref:Succinate dehydrogenase assembly factor 2, mitochondrial isoform X1 n=1 Tax=Elaeis guineensis var. tenera TaxID=51953 RepID=A0A6I9RPA0_ELAGV|nr:succinate dehydrogenase assembly factor 2, mitochondrial isoform X1 [Elaeis guineensis]
MATLRRALLRLHQTLTLTPPRSSQSLLGSHIGSISRFSSDRGSLDVDLSDEESKRRLHNRLLYRSRQRGFLELDLILGSWVEENIRSLDELHIRALMDVLDLENPDLWKWLTGQEQPPEAVNDNPVFTAVQSRVMGNLNSHAAPETRANPGQPWVRGWDDKRGQEGGPKYGNQ